MLQVRKKQIQNKDESSFEYIYITFESKQNKKNETNLNRIYMIIKIDNGSFRILSIDH